MDELLVRKARKGDKESFAEAVMLVKDQAYRIAYCYLHDREDSMDAVCDAVEKAFCNIKKLKDPRYFKTWFIRITINECKHRLRYRQRIESLADDIQSNDSHKMREDKLDLDVLLNGLPAAERILIYMKYYMGYTLEEIANLMEMPEGTVKTKIYGNLRKMKSCLELREV